MMPATSCPGMRGYPIPGKAPSLVSTSLWQTPQACTLMRTCPTPGLGTSRSTTWKSAPPFGTCATFIVAGATAVVAINPPLPATVQKVLPVTGDAARGGARSGAELNVGHLLAETP